MSRTGRLRAVWIGQLAVALILMALLWRHLDGAAALRLLATADAGWLAAALVALTLQTVLSAQRWRFTAGRLGLIISRSRALREYYLAQFANQTLPGGMIGDAGRAFRAREQAGLLRSSQAVLFERVAGQVMMLLVMIAGLALAGVVPGGPPMPGWTMAVVITAAIIVVAALLLLWLAPHVPGWLGRAFGGLQGAVARAFWGRRVLARQIALSLGATICNLLAFAFCARATGTVLAPIEIMVLVPLILYTMVVPLSVSGWGIREGVAAALFPLVGASAASGLAASTAFGLAVLASTLPGFPVLLMRDRMAGDGPSETSVAGSGLPPGNLTQRSKLRTGTSRIS